MSNFNMNRYRLKIIRLKPIVAEVMDAMSQSMKRIDNAPLASLKIKYGAEGLTETTFEISKGFVHVENAFGLKVDFAIDTELGWCIANHRIWGYVLDIYTEGHGPLERVRVPVEFINRIEYIHPDTLEEEVMFENRDE